MRFERQDVGARLGAARVVDAELGQQVGERERRAVATQGSTVHDWNVVGRVEEDVELPLEILAMWCGRRIRRASELPLSHQLQRQVTVGDAAIRMVVRHLNPTPVPLPLLRQPRTS